MEAERRFLSGGLHRRTASGSVARAGRSLRSFLADADGRGIEPTCFQQVPARIVPPHSVVAVPLVRAAEVPSRAGAASGDQRTIDAFRPHLVASKIVPRPC